MTLTILAKFQQGRDRVPRDAEETLMSQFTTRAHLKSRLVPGLTVDGPAMFHCPSCKTESPRPEHGDRWRCDCGLYGETYGNGLTIWR